MFILRIYSFIEAKYKLFWLIFTNHAMLAQLKYRLKV